MHPDPSLLDEKAAPEAPQLSEAERERILESVGFAYDCFVAQRVVAEVAERQYQQACTDAYVALSPIYPAEITFRQWTLAPFDAARQILVVDASAGPTPEQLAEHMKQARSREIRREVAEHIRRALDRSHLDG